jgi:hypothetical protein
MSGSLALITAFLVLAVQAFVSPVYAQLHDTAEIGDIVGIIQNIIKFLAPAAAIAFFIMVVVGGFKFLTSGGDPKAAASARSTLTFAILGVILVVVSWLILLLINQITGVDVTNVGLP